MEQERSKKQNAGSNADGPLLRGAPARMLLLELYGERVGDGGKNDDPSGMKIDGYPEDFADAHSGALRHIEWFWDAGWRAPEKCRSGFASLLLPCFLTVLFLTLLQ